MKRLEIDDYKSIGSTNGTTKHPQNEKDAGKIGAFAENS